MMFKFLSCGMFVLCLASIAQTKPSQTLTEKQIHQFTPRAIEATDENSAEFWTNLAYSRVENQKTLKKIEGSAKNVIIFMGDGMSIPTLTATRMYLGNENVELTMDKFPFSAISKTYCVDSQVADSACSATAYLGGVKGNIGTIGVTGTVKAEDCETMQVKSNQVRSIAAWFQDEGRSSGLVTTARVTHASPAGVYAHTSQRLWESDDDVSWTGADPAKCMDIAQMLIRNDIGSKLNVVFGGGYNNFVPVSLGGVRKDGNLLDEWSESHKNGKIVRNVKDLQSVVEEKGVDNVLGLFSGGHMKYYLEREEKDEIEPTLAEMTEAAIKVLQRNEKGFFLFVEGGKIDMAHHLNMAHHALEETVQFNKAIERALAMTSEEDTLVVVTADHAHTMSISGYPVRGNSILGVEGWNADDKMQFATLNYANGPSATEPRHNLTDDELAAKVDQQFPSLIPLESETHGGDDVVIMAKGPQAHLFSGVMEQNVIPHLMGYAACVGQGPQVCKDKHAPGGAMSPAVSIGVLVLNILLFLIIN